MVNEHPYTMTMSLNVLNHLGIYLYSNVPAVLAEAIANAWDADARTVTVVVDVAADRIVVTDDGRGMTTDDINQRYLHVGFDRRTADGTSFTPELHRPIMGRKGIGKLSLFSIANTVEVHSLRNGQRNAFHMTVNAIRQAISDEGSGDYHPSPIDSAHIEISRGTRLILTDLKKRLHRAAPALRRRLARRFSIIGDKHDFAVELNGTSISVEDRDYFHKVQYLWWYGTESKHYKHYCSSLDADECRPNQVTPDYTVRGWIGTVDKSTMLKDDNDTLNRIVVMARDKLAQEDILDEFSEGGIYASYVFGEMHADFLDLDGEDDISTTSRQRIIEDDPRYQALRTFVLGELKHIEAVWSDKRKQAGVRKAIQVPAISDWFKTLGPDPRRKAESLFGKINQLTLDSEDDRRRLFQHAVLAFESLRYKESLDSLDSLSPHDLGALSEVFVRLDDIEATLYHQIVSGRVAVIKSLHEKVDENAKEKVLRDHLFEHLWLLDPAWERSTDAEYMERTVANEFRGINARLSKDEQAGRVDIKYKRTTGAHVIVELKRADVVVRSTQLIEQVGKYRNALLKLLEAAGRSHEPVDVVSVVGQPLRDWAESNGRAESARMLEAKSIRVVLYQELLNNAHAAYQSFIEAQHDVGRIQRLIEALESEDLFAAAQ